MIKRIIEISQAKTYLSIASGQLVLKRDGSELARIPCEDIGILLVDHNAVTYTHSVFTELLKNRAAVVLCSADHHPAGMLLPLDSNSTQTETFRYQINAKAPLKKRLWQQIVKAKIAHQAKLVKDDLDAYRKLKTLKKKVRSGDPDNIEAQASRVFWPVFVNDVQFRRDINGLPPNNILNYGYTVLRAAIARALCCAGLLPTLGIHHRNKYNAFCLADDLIEPFRGFVEARVRDIYDTLDSEGQLDQSKKAAILETLNDNVTISGYTGPLMVGLHRTAASLQKCFAGKQDKLELPRID